MDIRQAVCLAAALWWCGATATAQTVVGVGQGGTGANTATGARARLGVAAAEHTHPVSALEGVSGKSGPGNVLLTFGGGAAEAATCAMFDSAGNLVSTGAACGVAAAGGPAFTQSFSNVSTVTMYHGLGTKNIVMACYDAEDRMVEVHMARAATAMQAEVTFTDPQSGRCVVQGTGGGDYSFAELAGVAGLAQGGTNQTSWTAGRCVQVAPDGSRLESAGDACGVGSGEATAVANSGPGAQVLKAGTNVTGRTLVAGENVVIAQGADTITISAMAGAGEVETGEGLLGTGSPADPLRVNPATVPAFETVSATLNGWATVAAASCQEQTFSFAGALSNDAVVPRWPAGLPAGLVGWMFVSEIDTMAVRICNPTGTGISIANGFQFGATILRSF